MRIEAREDTASSPTITLEQYTAAIRAREIESFCMDGDGDE